MNKIQLLRGKLKETPLSRRVLRARLSLKETQQEFAARFYVSHITIYNWEKGRTERIQAIHNKILETITKNLEKEGRLLPEDLLATLYREEEARHTPNAPTS